MKTIRPQMSQSQPNPSRTPKRLTGLARMGVTMTAVGMLTGGVFSGIAHAAAQFQQQEVEQSRYVAIAMPLAGGGRYRLIVVNQITDARPCWSESGQNPTRIEPLLVTFDFTGICGRSTDSNGYSIRVGGQDLGLRYSLLLEQHGNELVLVGRENSGNSAAPYMVIGRTNGMLDGFHRINLQPGWRFSRRAYESKVLGHIYFTNDSMAAALNQSGPAPVATPNFPAAPTTTLPSIPTVPTVPPPVEVAPRNPASVYVPTPQPQPQSQPSNSNTRSVPPDIQITPSYPPATVPTTTPNIVPVPPPVRGMPGTPNSVRPAPGQPGNVAPKPVIIRVPRPTSPR
jgi:hypothetical protein